MPLSYNVLTHCVSLTPYGRSTRPSSTRCNHVVPVRPGPAPIISGSRLGDDLLIPPLAAESRIPAKIGATDRREAFSRRRDRYEAVLQGLRPRADSAHASARPAQASAEDIARRVPH